MAKPGVLPIKPIPLSERGRILYVDDVRKMLGYTRSRWWVLNHFAPEYKRKIGRTPYWWESDAQRWMDRSAA